MTNTLFPAALTLSLATCVAFGTNVAAEVGLERREPAFNVLNTPNSDVVRVGTLKTVGEASFFVIGSHFQVTVTTNQPSCHLSKVYFGNLPFISLEGMKQKKYTFQLPLGEVESFLCGFGGKYSEIFGEVKSVCSEKDGVEQEYHEFFRKRIRCFDDPPKVDPPIMPLIDPSAFEKSTFHMNIPKTGSSSLIKMIVQLMSELQGGDGNHSVCEIPGTFLDEPSMGKEFFDDPTGTKWAIETGRRGCIFVHGHRPFNDIPTRKYTVMHEPREHVIAQFFHCAKSRIETQGATNSAIPTLDEFLLRWVQAIDDRNLAPYEYNCFDPINLQDKYLQVGKLDNLKDKVTFVGLTSRLVTSACIEVIEVTGLVPQSCDCTSDVSGSRIQLEWKNMEAHPESSFEPTEEQLKLIDQLTTTDRVLYDEAVRLFAETVSRIESEHRIRLC